MRTFSITFVVQENLILFQLVKLLQKFLPSFSDFPFFRVLDKTVSSLSLQNGTDCNELTDRISGGVAEISRHTPKSLAN